MNFYFLLLEVNLACGWMATSIMAELTRVRPLEIQCSRKQRTSMCRTLKYGPLNNIPPLPPTSRTQYKLQRGYKASTLDPYKDCTPSTWLLRSPDRGRADIQCTLHLISGNGQHGWVFLTGVPMKVLYEHILFTHLQPEVL